MSGGHLRISGVHLQTRLKKGSFLRIVGLLWPCAKNLYLRVYHRMHQHSYSSARQLQTCFYKTQCLKNRQQPTNIPARKVPKKTGSRTTARNVAVIAFASIPDCGHNVRIEMAVAHNSAHRRLCLTSRHLCGELYADASAPAASAWCCWSRWVLLWTWVHAHTRTVSVAKTCCMVLCT